MAGLLDYDWPGNPFFGGNGVPPSPFLTNLTGYWPLPEASGQRLSVVGSSPLTPNGLTLPGNTPGVNGDALLLDQTQLQVLDGGNVLSPNGQFTVAAWVKPVTGVVGTTTVMSKWDQGGSAEFRLFRLSNGNIHLGVTSDGSVATLTTAVGLASLNVWTFVMGWWDGSNIHTRVGNAESTGVAFAGPLFSGAIPFRIGALYGTSGAALNPWHGAIDEAAIWTRALGPTERSDLYNAGAGKFYPF